MLSALSPIIALPQGPGAGTLRTAADGPAPVDVTLGVVLAVAAAALLLGIAKGGFSGLGPLMTILVAVAVPTSVAIGVLLPLLMIGDVFALWAHWGHWDSSIIRRLIPGATVGVFVASIALQSLSDDGLRIGIAVVTIAFVLYRLAGLRRTPGPVPAGGRTPLAPIWGWAAGTAAGVTSTIAHVGGPPVAVYLLTERVPPRAYVASSAALFFFINWMKVPGYIAAELVEVDVLLRLAPTALLIGPGILLGRAFVTRVNQRVFDNIILVSLVVGALLLLVD